MLWNAKKDYKYSDIIGFFEDQQVVSFSVDVGKGKLSMQVLESAFDKDAEKPAAKVDEIDVTKEPTKKVEYELASVDMFYMDIEEYVKEYNETHTIRMERDYEPAKDNSFLLDLIPIILLVTSSIIIHCLFQS